MITMNFATNADNPTTEDLVTFSEGNPMSWSTWMFLASSLQLANQVKREVSDTYSVSFREAQRNESQEVRLMHQGASERRPVTNAHISAKSAMPSLALQKNSPTPQVQIEEPAPSSSSHHAVTHRGSYHQPVGLTPSGESLSESRHQLRGQQQQQQQQGQQIQQQRQPYRRHDRDSAFGMARVIKREGATVRNGVDMDDSMTIDRLEYGKEVPFDRIVTAGAIPGETVAVQRLHVLIGMQGGKEVWGWASLHGRTTEDMNPILQILSYPAPQPQACDVCDTDMSTMTDSERNEHVKACMQAIAAAEAAMTIM